MERFGNEAESEKLAEARRQAKKVRIAKIKKAFFVIILLGIGVSCWLNRQALADASRKVYNSTFGIAESVTRNGEETKNKAKELHDNASKRNQVIDDIIK